MKKKWVVTLSLITLLAAIGLVAGPLMSSVEKPKYEVLSSANSIEVRKYGPVIVAEVQVKGERESAISEGFKILADYIFGNNTVNQTLKMTAPVLQTQNEKIKMTAPVIQKGKGDLWTVMFVMPSRHTISSLPKPNNKQVSLKEIPEKKIIAIRFSGQSSSDNIQKHMDTLLRYIEENNINVLASPMFAFYNPPWTLPIFRRNEILIELQ